MLKVISGSSNQALAHQVAKQLNQELIDVELSTFANGEKRVWIKGDVQGKNVVLVQSFSAPTDEHIMEFLLLSDALERLGARHINLVLPWMGYSLQDKSFREGEPIAAKVVANLVSNAYVKRVFLLDQHNSSTPGFFSIPTRHLSAISLFEQYAREHFDLQNVVVASPDFGGLKRARQFANKLGGVPLINIDKNRDLRTGEITAMDLHGDVQGKTVLLFDDVINSGGTVVSSAEVLKDNGAQAVHFMATHGIFANNGQQRVLESRIDTVIVTNSIAQQPHEKILVLDTSAIFASDLAVWGN